MVVASVKKLMEAYGTQGSEERPSVYVGTYGKYNGGSLEGGWVNLDEFDSKQDFLRYCIQQLHANERDAELIFQDWEYIPDGFIGESFISDRLWDFINLDTPYDVKLAVANALNNPEEAINVLESGDYRLFPGCDSVEDIVYEYLDEGIMPSRPENYFDYERFDGSGSCYSFIEITCNRRVKFAYFAIDLDQSVLKKRKKNHNRRKDRYDHEREPCIDAEHNDHNANEIRKVPNTVHDSPRDQRTYPGCVAHYSRMDVTNTVLVVKGEGQCLKMSEYFVSHVLIDVDFDLHGIRT